MYQHYKHRFSLEYRPVLMPLHFKSTDTGIAARLCFYSPQTFIYLVIFQKAASWHLVVLWTVFALEDGKTKYFFY